MQRAAARASSLAIRRLASSGSRRIAPVASLLPATAALNAGTRLSVQPTAAAAAAALCAWRGYATGPRKTKAAVSDEEEEEDDDEFEDMGSDEEFDDDSDDEDLDDEEVPVKKRGRC